MPATDQLNVRQTADLLGVHENTVRNWADTGKLTDVSPAPLRARRFDVEQVTALARKLRRERFLKPRPEVVNCPVCGLPTYPQPRYTNTEWSYICDTKNCPVSSFALKWETMQEDLADAIADSAIA